MAYTREDWIRDLRSGEYKQGIGFLVYNLDAPEFCCLGVCMDAAGIPVKKMDNVATEIVWAPELHDDLEYADQRKALCESLKLSRDQMHELATMNDDKRTFGEIADCIAQMPDGKPGVWEGEPVKGSI